MGDGCSSRCGLLGICCHSIPILTRTEQCAALRALLPQCPWALSEGVRDLPSEDFFRPDRSYSQLVWAMRELDVDHKIEFAGYSLLVELRSRRVLTRARELMTEIVDVECWYNSNWILLSTLLDHLKKVSDFS